MKLKVKVGKNTGKEIKTEVGSAKGDYLSAVLFIYYLARSIDPTIPDTDHNYACIRFPILQAEHGYYKPS